MFATSGFIDAVFTRLLTGDKNNAVKLSSRSEICCSALPSTRPHHLRHHGRPGASSAYKLAFPFHLQHEPLLHIITYYYYHILPSSTIHIFQREVRTISSEARLSQKDGQSLNKDALPRDSNPPVTFQTSNSQVFRFIEYMIPMIFHDFSRSTWVFPSFFKANWLLGSWTQTRLGGDPGRPPCRRGDGKTAME